MNETGKRDGLRQIIDNELAEMDFDRFDPGDVNLAEFCRKSGLTRSKARTLRRKTSGAVHARCGQKAARTVVTGCEDALDELLREGVASSSVCLEGTRARGYTGGVAMAERHISENVHLVPAPRRLAPEGRSRGQRHETAPGEALQTDWGLTDAEDPAGDAWRMARLAMACHRCGTCCMGLFPDARQENLSMGMARALLVMGVPERVLADDMKGVVLCRDHGGRPVWQRDHAALMECAGLIRTRPCKPCLPFARGKAERPVRYVRGNLPAGRAFADITGLNEQALEWCALRSLVWRRSTDLVPAGGHAAACLPAMSALERTDELAMRLRPERKAGFDGSVYYEGRRFGVPYWHEGRSCRAIREGGPLHACSADMSAGLAVHAAAWGRRDGACPGQWLGRAGPEGLPTAPVRTRVMQLEAPERAAGLDRLDSGRMP